MRNNLAELRKELDQMNRQLVLLDQQGKFQTAFELQAKAQKVFVAAGLPQNPFL